ncbi:hypothetical protein H8356DRAFT_1659038 [Neocallimastix lanati (nom. inval.)]|nr:hypothetical protein H8356DRAFT_1659038 [Neocallimastix sp. JGI-2020a]
MCYSKRITSYDVSDDNDTKKNPFYEDYSNRIPEDVNEMDYYLALSSNGLIKSNTRYFCSTIIRLKNSDNRKNLAYYSC